MHVICPNVPRNLLCYQTVKGESETLLDHVLFWSALVSTFMVVLTFPIGHIESHY
jgi:hypothetical protein